MYKLSSDRGGMPADLKGLIASPQLALSLVSRAGTFESTEVNWVHSSDLADPTPFLSPGNVLLTTGSQWADPTATEVSDYVSRLVAAGVPALGFGVGVNRAATPTTLVAACDDAGLSLFEVPYATPFIAVAQAVATTMADERYARNTWSLKAQRAIARAALRADGLHACLRELSVQLGEWVCLTDAGGGVVLTYPAETSADIAPAVTGEAAHLLVKGARASRRVRMADASFSIQTIGSAHRLHAALAVGESRPVDHATTEVIDCIVALVGLSLEQRHVLSSARMSVRSAALSLVLAGHVRLAETLARQLQGGLPTPPLAVLIVPVDDGFDYLAEWFALHTSAFGDPLFARDGDELVALVTPAHLSALQGALAELQIRSQARVAEHFDEVSGALAGARLELRTAHLAEASSTRASELRLLTEHDRTHHSELVSTLRTWFDVDCNNERAAARLGVHRHTLRARLALASQLLDRDLASFTYRAALWQVFESSRSSAGR